MNKKYNLINLIIIAAVSIGAGTLHAAEMASKDQILAAANKNTQPYMQSIATSGYIYGLPYVGMYQMMIDQVINKNIGFNAYAHDRTLATPDTTFIPSPNNDTLYSKVWLDLRTEPAVLEFPEMGDRYFSVQLFDINSDLLGYIGTRETGKTGGKFLIVGPDWDGQIPAGFKNIYRANGNFVLGLGRTLINGPADLETVQAIQDKYIAASLSNYQSGNTGGGNTNNLPAFMNQTPSDFFATLSNVLKINPVIDGEKGIIANLNNIAVGPMIIDTPNYKYDDNTITDGYNAGIKSLSGALQFWGKFVNGWKLTISGVGTYGYDYMQRAVVWQGGALANDPKEAIYPTAMFDSEGQALDGTNDYVLKFSESELPAVNYFWSLTLYDARTTFLVPNELNRYSIGDRTPGVKYDSDGGMTIYISQKNPGGDKELNWLKAPDGPFYLVLRMYGPKESVLTGKWEPVGLQRVETK